MKHTKPKIEFLRPSMPKFTLGNIVATPGVLAAFQNAADGSQIIYNAIYQWIKGNKGKRKRRLT